MRGKGGGVDWRRVELRQKYISNLNIYAKEHTVDGGMDGGKQQTKVPSLKYHICTAPRNT